MLRVNEFFKNLTDNHPAPNKVSTIIVFRPGAIRQPLRATLALLPQIEITGAAGGGLSALNLARQNRRGC